jgi:hypothetical protein
MTPTKALYIVFIFTWYFIPVYSQQNETVLDIIEAINQDTLIKQIRIISSEDPYLLDGEETFIPHRINGLGNEESTNYLVNVLSSYGLEVEVDTYREGGDNILATKVGTVYPDEYYIICAHYDAVTYYAADDDASGTAAVLEAARIFKDYSFEYSIIFALWDEEELGLVGSYDYAERANQLGMDIKGVINMDMIAYDGDGDRKLEVHSRNFGNSIQLSNDMVEFAEDYNFDIELVQYLTNGAMNSDHRSFWQFGYTAVLLIEELSGGDFNPWYHQIEDRVDILDMDYFTECATFTIAVTASLATPDETVGLPAISAKDFIVYPNPAKDDLIISSDIPMERVSLYTLDGKQIRVTTDFVEKQRWDISDVPSGLYLLQIATKEGIGSKKIMIQ